MRLFVVVRRCLTLAGIGLVCSTPIRQKPSSWVASMMVESSPHPEGRCRSVWDGSALRGPFLRFKRVRAPGEGKLPPRSPACIAGQIWGLAGRVRHGGLGWETIRQMLLCAIQSREFSEVLTRKGAAEQRGPFRVLVESRPNVRPAPTAARCAQAAG